MKIFAVAGLTLAVGAGVAAFAAQSRSGAQEATSIKSLAEADAAIDALTLRLALLEDRLEKVESGGATASLPAAGGARVMKVESIQTVQPDAETLEQVRQMNADADELDDKALSFEANASSITVDNSDDADDAARRSALKQRNLYKSQGAEAKRQAKQLRAEAKRLSAPRQVIRGWTGTKSVELRTDRDLSNPLTNIRIGSFVTAKGTLLDADDASAIVMITSISTVAAPADFKDRPKGQ